ncbi:MAG TPA: PAS domain S-box protein [Bryobacteraceae bacterium]|nr:PAS domain S-box protein [Bryobacteraceae bacterium]
MQQEPASDALRQSERRFRALIENSSEGLLLLDESGKILLSGPPILGYAPDHARGRTMFEVIHPEDRDTVMRAFGEIVRNPAAVVKIEYRARHTEGSWRWMEAEARNLLSDPAVQGVVINYRDITEWKAIHDELRERAELLDLAQDAILLLRLDGTIDFWNRGAHDLYGWSREEALIQNAHTLLHTKFPEPFADLRRKLVEIGTWQGELVHQKRDGASVTVASRWALRRDSSGRAIGFLEINRDITERKRIEEQLRHTQKLESLGVLAGGVAHDFNNLLTGVIGNASLALDCLAPTDSTRVLLESVLDGAERAAHLTRQLLAYAGKGRFVVEPVNFSALVEEMAGLLRTTIPKNVHLRLDLAHDLPLLPVDLAQMQQVVMNLVINGAEAIPEGTEGTVIVTTRTQTLDEPYIRQMLADDGVAPGDYIALEVHDSGTGMSPEVQARIFDPFFTTKFAGRGLGLSAVLGIVRGHGGALKIYSTPGRGTTFKLLFPVTAVPALPEAAIPKPPPLAAGWGTVLVVDDEEIVRRTAAAALQRAGYEVLTANDGRQAVDQFRRHRGAIRLVILDMTMPVLSGEPTLRELRSIDPAVPVILSSGYNEVEAVQRFAGKGLAGFLQKPYAARTLLEMAHRLLAR